jgi:hypothetical protein
MRKITAPTHTVADVVICFDGHIESADLQQRLVDSVQALEVAEVDYKAKGLDELLYQIAEADNAGQLTLAEMKGMYTRMSRKGGHARHIYDAIKLLSPGGICPLCCQRTVSTLDHYLAKGRHAAFTITPWNLVPACKDCNTDTNERRPTCRMEQTLHPYFDEVDDDIWLFATIEQTTPPSASFFVAKPDSWTEDKYQRVRHHFETFGLGILYATHAAGEIVTYSHAARRLHSSAAHEVAGAAGVKAYFDDLSQDRRHETRNTWQAALCQALADSDWYCAGGFNQAIRSE